MFITDVLRGVNGKRTDGPIVVDSAECSCDNSGMGGDKRETVLEILPGQWEWGAMNHVKHAVFPIWKRRFGNEEGHSPVGLNGLRGGVYFRIETLMNCSVSIKSSTDR